jgi:predicted nuclease of predicted toxin-antitoxin system
VRFLIDNALSPDVAAALAELGHDAVHVRSLGWQSRSDDEIFDFAAKERRVIVSADTDFSQILAQRRARTPSVVLLRDGTERVPSKQPPLIDRWTTLYEGALLAGAVLIVEHGRCRVRPLPIVPPPRRRRAARG